MGISRGLAAAAGNAAVLAAVVLAVAGCGHGGADGRTGNASGNPGNEPGNAPGTWTVDVAGERSGPYGQCLDDPVIDEAFQSADYPSSHLGIRLAASATAADAERIAECLRRNLTSGVVTVTGPARVQ